MRTQSATASTAAARRPPCSALHRFSNRNLSHTLGSEMFGLARMSHKFEKRCEARQSEIRARSVLAYVTKRIAVITPPRALVVLRFLLNNPQRTVCFWPICTILFHTITYIRSAETGEMFGLEQTPLKQVAAGEEVQV